MEIALVAFVACIGVAATAFVAWRMWRAARAGAPSSLLLGYLILMVAVSAVILLVLRLV